jgi:hypothetical protein
MRRVTEAVSEERRAMIREVVAVFGGDAGNVIPLLEDDDKWDGVRAHLARWMTDDVVFGWVTLGQRIERHGLEGLREQWLDWFEPWSHYTLEAYEVRMVGPDAALCFARQVGTPPDGAPIELDGVALVKLGGDRICAIDFYARREEALEAAGQA